MKRGRKTGSSSYPKLPVGLVFKTSNRSNAQIKLKIWKNKNVDDIIDGFENGTLSGVPKKAVFVNLGMGVGPIERFKGKYNI